MLVCLGDDVIMVSPRGCVTVCEFLTWNSTGNHDNQSNYSNEGSLWITQLC
jgi:hypothetical protein